MKTMRISSSGFAMVRKLLLLVAAYFLVNLVPTARASTELLAPFHWGSMTFVHSAMLAPLLQPEALADETSPPPTTYRDKLIEAANSYLEQPWIPYVYGGGKIGDRTSCESCRQCLMTRRKVSLHRRLAVCKSCQACGIDCSHFVNRVFKDAGLDYSYLPTAMLKRLSAKALREKYSFIDIGKDPLLAQPGDLILTRRHVVMLLSLHDNGFGDIIHSTRFGGPDKLGGIRRENDIDLRTFRGKIFKILRHVALQQERAVSVAQQHLEIGPEPSSKLVKAVR